jgi:hypothetical protein
VDVTCWVRRAAERATAVPAQGKESDIWTVRGWAEVALACLVLHLPFDALDEVIEERAIPSGGPPADRLRALRAQAGRVPRSYPHGGSVGCAPRSAVNLEACEIMDSWYRAVRIPIPQPPACRPNPRPADTTNAAGQLRWGMRHRPSPGQVPTVIDGSAGAGAIWRSWLRLPGAGPALFAAPRAVVPARARVWRGIHEGAHLDHLAATGHDIEFGAGLLVAEAYAMAVEIVALVTCLLDGEYEEAWWLREGLAERTARAQEGTGEFAALPRLANAYVAGSLELLAGHDPGRALPPRLRHELLARWKCVREVYAPADALARRLAGLSSVRTGSERRPASRPSVTSLGG